jgi:hypothetical protein
MESWTVFCGGLPTYKKITKARGASLEKRSDERWRRQTLMEEVLGGAEKWRGGSDVKVARCICISVCSDDRLSSASGAVLFFVQRRRKKRRG